MFRTLSIAAATIAVVSTGIVATAQTDKKPWQATLTKFSQALGEPRIFMDVPTPPAGRLLTVERVGVTVGPMNNNSGKITRCEIESDRPQIDAAPFLESRTRLFLPLPVQLGEGTRIWAVLNAPVRIYSQKPDGVGRTFFRVSCDGESISWNDDITVTVVGYTTPVVP
jgi:hypothetical protein